MPIQPILFIYLSTYLFIHSFTHFSNQYLLSICYIGPGTVQALRTQRGIRKIPMAPDTGGREEIYRKVPNHIIEEAAYITYVGSSSSKLKSKLFTQALLGSHFSCALIFFYSPPVPFASATLTLLLFSICAQFNPVLENLYLWFSQL